MFGFYETVITPVPEPCFLAFWMRAMRSEDHYTGDERERLHEVFCSVLGQIGVFKFSANCGQKITGQLFRRPLNAKTLRESLVL